MAFNKWTSDEVKLAYFLYCQLPFGKLHSRNKEIIELANLLGRTPGSIAMKLVNLASLDTNITSNGRVGLKNASKIDRAVWEELNQNWDAFADEVIRKRQTLEKDFPQKLNSEHHVNENGLTQDYFAEDKLAIVSQRQKQNFFRRTILTSYNQRCCMSGLSEPKLLVASHIVAWSEDASNRLNPANGLCLSALHDKAFDQHLISLDEDFRIVLSDTIKERQNEDFIQSAFIAIAGKQIELPNRFRPNLKLLAIHRSRTQR